jgi:hypothetical protein
LNDLARGPSKASVLSGSLMEDHAHQNVESFHQVWVFGWLMIALRNFVKVRSTACRRCEELELVALHYGAACRRCGELELVALHYGGPAILYIL